jgi:RimJ/RimL family protein N-acetyltransferase
MLHQRGYAKMFLLFLRDEMVGVLSFNQIEPLNKTGYIGYWIDEHHQGQGCFPGAAGVYALLRSPRRSPALRD